mgnify:CR=1 FL=1|jgi:hypothetical protein|tara:strand:+ start:23 stop:229 length:207 start_codon:yes stop_codon:yes gene_type:complete
MKTYSIKVQERHEVLEDRIYYINANNVDEAKEKLKNDQWEDYDIESYDSDFCKVIWQGPIQRFWKEKT